ncbi:MAG: flavodoxin domain-containing protein [Acidimicrobiia bacterium]
MSRVLVAYHTIEGQAGRIARRIDDVLAADGATVDLVEVEHAPPPDAYDGVVFGDSIHVVHHSRQLSHYLRAHADAVNRLPSALFQVSMTSANPDDEHTAQALGLVHELCDKTGFDPDVVGMFAGALAYTQYGWIKKRIMRSISKKEHGETDTSRDFEYTDWAAVEQFAHDVAALVEDRTAVR